jgi:site-specific recombinase XerD
MTLSLFPDTDLMQREIVLREIFQAWVAHRARSTSRRRSERPFREESAKVYQEMWYAFAAYCAARNLDIADIEDTDLQTFLALRGTGAERQRPRHTMKGGELSPRYAWRVLTLIDEVTRFEAKREGREPNPAARLLRQRPEYRYANASDADPLPEYYGEAHAKRLIDYLTQIQNHDAQAGPLPWKEVRDRTALVVMLGGGLTPGDVRALMLDGVITEGGRKLNVPWKLALPGNGNSPARETPLAQWAGRQLAFWLRVRTQQAIEGHLVFPSTQAGKPWSHTACYNACKSVLSSTGMGDDSGGVFKLRHTFALRQLAKGKSETEVAQWLGLLDLNGMARYRRIVPRPIDVV